MGLNLEREIQRLLDELYLLPKDNQQHFEEDSVQGIFYKTLNFYFKLYWIRNLLSNRKR